MSKESQSSLAYESVGDTFSGGIADPHEMFLRYRKNEPVLAGDIVTQLGIPSRASAADGSRLVFSLFGYRDIMKVLRDDALFSSGLLLEGLGTFLGRIVTGLDGDEHRRTRALLQPAFMPAVIEAWDREIVRPVVDEMVAELGQGDSADLLKDFALHFPVRVIYAIIGFPQDRDAIERFSAWALAILSGPQIDPEKAQLSRKAAFQAAQDLYDHVLPIVAQRRAEGSHGLDMIGTLLRAQHDGQALTDGEVASFVRMLLPAAAETTTRSFANLMALLLQRPALMAQLRADRSLIPGAINEAMRFEAPVAFLARQAMRDTEIGGVPIPAGAGLSLVISSGNRDEAVFADADQFDIYRKPTPALGFGYGVHMCIGMTIAKMEMACALNALFDRFASIEPIGEAPQIVGAHFRSPTALNVRWR